MKKTDSATPPLRHYPEWVCLDCGNKYGRGTVGRCCTTHIGVCGVCGDEKAVTEPRDFGHLKPEWDTHLLFAYSKQV